MKKTLLCTLVLALGTVLTQAQITIDNTNIASPGTVVIEATDTATNVSPGSTGANQTWDFSGIDSHSTDTIDFMNPAWLDGGVHFPNANLAMYFRTDSASMYLNNTTNKLEVLGQYADFGAGWAPVNFVPAMLFMEWPATFQDAFSAPAGLELAFYIGAGPMGPDSVKSVQNLAIDGIVDAWGSVTTPLGTFDALRIKRTTITADSTFLYMDSLGWFFDTLQVDTSFEYQWWSDDASAVFPIISFETDAQDQLIDWVKWLAVTPTPSAIKELQKNGGLSVYPNPAADIVTFSGISNGIIDLYDINSRLVLSQRINNVTQLNVQHLTRGTYNYRASDSEGTLLETGKLNIVK